MELSSWRTLEFSIFQHFPWLPAFAGMAEVEFLEVPLNKKFNKKNGVLLKTFQSIKLLL